MYYFCTFGFSLLNRFGREVNCSALILFSLGKCALRGISTLIFTQLLEESLKED